MYFELTVLVEKQNHSVDFHGKYQKWSFAKNIEIGCCIIDVNAI